MHLPRQANRLHRSVGLRLGCTQCGKRTLRGGPPVFGLLLTVAGMRAGNVQCHPRIANNLMLLVEQQCLHFGSADVDAEKHGEAAFENLKTS